MSEDTRSSAEDAALTPEPTDTPGARPEAAAAAGVDPAQGNAEAGIASEAQDRPQTPPEAARTQSTGTSHIPDDAEGGATPTDDALHAVRKARSGRAPAQRLITAAVALALIALAFVIGRATAPPPEEDDEEDAEVAEAAGPEIEYICPMHPQIRQDHFGTCPICHMDLVSVEKGGEDAEPTVRLSDDAAERGGLRTETVRRVPLEYDLRLFGRVEARESGDVDLTAWTGGRIERLFVTDRGDTVRRGQRIATLYSPALVSAQQSLLQAERVLRAHADPDRAAPSRARIQAAEAAASAARNELRLLGMRASDIEAIVAEDQVREIVPIHATAAGTVQRRMVSTGDWVQTGDTLLSLVALDSVWVQLEAFERDLPHLSTGLPVEIEVPALGNRRLEGTIAFIDPVIDPVRRVARARVVLPNEGGQLRPGALVRARARIPHTETPIPLSVPASAVLWTGQRSVVYVLDSFASPPGFIAAEVTLGERIGDRWIIRDGVFETENIASRGAFRLDASLQISGGPSMMGRQAPDGAAGDDPSPHGQPSDTPGGHDHGGDHAH